MNPAVKERLLVSHGPHGASKKPEEEVAAQVSIESVFLQASQTHATCVGWALGTRNAMALG